uniref:Secreted protein n=1 Tax=Bursaphelenchus xylophilus TaxID=6326 RepID=A0A1I7SHQ8_BURXY
MFTLTSLCCLLALAAAAPAEKEVEAADTLTYGVDFVDEIDSRHVTCFRNLNYNLVLVRIYNGGVDEVGFRNLDTVYSKFKTKQ